MRTAEKAKRIRACRRDLFMELTEGITALADERRGSRTLRKHRAVEAMKWMGHFQVSDLLHRAFLSSEHLAYILGSTRPDWSAAQATGATMDLPGPIAAYVSSANSQDARGVAACFSKDAIVRDEGQTRQGIAAIGQWAEEVGRKYRPSLEVLEISETDGVTIVAGRVSGDFPGSPIVLHYRFTLDGTKIARLEIGT